MKKILILANHAITIYNFRMELVRRLVKEGNEVYLSAPYSELIEDIKEEHCVYREIKLDRRGMNPFKDCKLIWEYRKLINEIKPNIIFSYTIKPNIYGGIAARNTHTPFVANITGLGSAVQKNALIKQLVIGLYKMAFRNVKTVFFQNEDNKLFFENRGIALGRHKLLPGSGVNLERFAIQEYPEAEDDAVEFVFISRVMKEKGIDEYLEATNTLKERYPKAKFHICGFCEDNYEEKLTQLQNQGIIIYHGLVKDIREVLKDIHCVVLPSYHEGMSNVLLEAAASGRPLIASDIPGCRECFEDGIGGYRVKVKDSVDLTSKMEQFIKLSHEERKQMGLQARKHVEQRFDRQQIVDAYMQELSD